MILQLNLFLLTHLIVAAKTMDSTPEYTETPSTTIRYHPHESNHMVLGQGAKEDDYGLILRHDKMNGGFIYFTGDNESKNWSFEFTIRDFEFHFPEEAGIYLWYTEHHQEPGQFKGVDGHFEGLMAGLEFKGTSPELVMTLNEGFKIDHEKEVPLVRDSFDPARLKNVRDLTVKVIVTEKNFKIELYNGETLIYDSLRFVYDHPFAMLGSDKKFTISSFYKDVSAERAFKVTKAQLYKRDEHDHYDAEKIHAANVMKTSQKEGDIAHPDKEIRHFIAQFYHFVEYIHTVLGEPNAPLLSKFSKEINDKIDSLKKDISPSENNSIKQSNMVFGNRMNDIELRIQRLQKDFSDFEHFLRVIEEKHSSRSDFISYTMFVIGVICVVVMGVREYYAHMIVNKKL